MTQHQRSQDRSLRQLLWRHGRLLWPLILLLIALSLAANALLVLQPLLLGAMLSMILGAPASTPGVATGFFDLNQLGGRLLPWLQTVAPSSLGSLWVLGALFCAQALLAAGLNYAALITAFRIKIRTIARLQADLARHLLGLTLRFFHREKSGELQARFVQDMRNIANGLGPVIQGFVHHGVQIVVLGLFLWSTSRWLTLGAFAFVVLHLGFNQVMKGPIRARLREALDAQADFATVLQEMFLQIRTAKSFGAEAFEHRKLQARIDRMERTSNGYGWWEQAEQPVRSVFDTLAILGILAIALLQLRAGALTTQGFLLYLYVGRLLIGPINHMATNLLWIQVLRASYERIGGLLAQQPEIRDGERVKADFTQSIELRGVSFSHGQQRVLHDINLEIRRGEIVALVGPSGAGKSTLADLVLRLYDPDAGRVLIDGEDVQTLRQAEYRRLFGVVPQETLLFHDTVAENIRFGRPNLQQQAEIEQAARIANAHEFISRLPEGYDTIVGDRGVRLSGGERQRVAIARALAHRPQILVLDEATSSLDSDSEHAVQEAIERAVRGMTSLIIAHRLSTVLRADRIAVLEAGRICHAGRHGELLEHCPLYQHLYGLHAAAAEVA